MSMGLLSSSVWEGKGIAMKLLRAQSWHRAFPSHVVSMCSGSGEIISPSWAIFFSSECCDKELQTEPFIKKVANTAVHH